MTTAPASVPPSRRRARGGVRLPRPTVGLRLTLLYGALFAASGTVLLAVTYLLVDRTTTGTVFAVRQVGAEGGSGALVTVNSSGGQTFIAGVPVAAPFGGVQDGVPPDPQQLDSLAQNLTSLAAQQRDSQLRQLLVQSGIALAGMLAFSLLLGSLIAGRFLQPLRAITSAVHSISARNLHHRLSVRGPDDEIKELGDTFDGLLERLERSFGAQRQFIANASHELRTPLARQRTLLEVALRDPDASVDSLRAASARVLAAGEQQERIIESLLTLARSERGLDSRQPCDLAAITEEVLLARSAEAEQRGVHVTPALDPATIAGDADLVERLVTNLVDNAIRHNVDGGAVTVSTRTEDARAVLSVTNTGASVDPQDLERLFRPFERASAARAARPDGAGLGLSIVQAIAVAHGASLRARPRDGGGLEVEIGFPEAAPAS